jgi:hypothetical protein
MQNVDVSEEGWDYFLNFVCWVDFRKSSCVPGQSIASTDLCLCLRALAADTACKLNVLGHNGHTLGMNSTQVGIFKESDKIGFCGFLESKDSRSLEAKVTLEVLGYLTNKTLKGDCVHSKIK